MNQRKARRYVDFVKEITEMHENYIKINNQDRALIEKSLDEFILISNKYFRLKNDDWSRHLFIDERFGCIACHRNQDKSEPVILITEVEEIYNDLGLYFYFKAIGEVIGFYPEDTYHRYTRDIVTLERAKNVLIAIAFDSINKQLPDRADDLNLIEKSFTPSKEETYQSWFERGLQGIDSLLRDGLFAGHMEINNYKNLILCVTMIKVSEDLGYAFEVGNMIDEQIDSLKKSIRDLKDSRDLEKMGF